MIIDESIKRVTVGNPDIQGIMHGGGILWEKEKVYRIVWSKVGSTDSDDTRYNNSLYTSYKIERGKIIPGKKYDILWGDIKYYIDTSRNTIKKFKNTGTRYESFGGGERAIMNYDIYDGKIIGYYR